MKTVITVGSGIDTYLSQLGRLQTMAPENCGKAIYEGAKIVADEVRHGIDSLPVSKTKNYKGTNKVRGVTPEQKKGLQDGFGISRAKNDGSFRNVKLGFDG